MGLSKHARAPRSWSGNGIRTRDPRLEGWRSTAELFPRTPKTPPSLAVRTGVGAHLVSHVPKPHPVVARTEATHAVVARVGATRTSLQAHPCRASRSHARPARLTLVARVGATRASSATHDPIRASGARYNGGEEDLNPEGVRQQIYSLPPFVHLGTSPNLPARDESFLVAKRSSTLALAGGIEPPTHCLQGSCSAPELRQHRQSSKLFVHHP